MYDDRVPKTFMYDVKTGSLRLCLPNKIDVLTHWVAVWPSHASHFPFFSNGEIGQLNKFLNAPHSDFFDIRINNKFVNLSTQGRTFGELHQEYYVKMMRKLPRNEDRDINTKLISHLLFISNCEQIDQYMDNTNYEDCIFINKGRPSLYYPHTLFDSFYNIIKYQANITIWNFTNIDEHKTKVDIVGTTVRQRYLNGPNRIYTLRLHADPSEWVTEERIRSLSFFQFISNIGGTLGIWTGSSIVSLIHLVATLVAWLYRTFCKSASNQVAPGEQNVQPRPIENHQNDQGDQNGTGSLDNQNTNGNHIIANGNDDPRNQQLHERVIPDENQAEYIVMNEISPVS